MNAQKTRRRNKTARTFAVVLLAFGMLPTTGCIGPLATALGGITKILGPLTSILNIGQMFKGGSSSLVPNLSATPGLQLPNFKSQSGDVTDTGTADAAEKVVSSTKTYSEDYQLPGSDSAD